MAAYRIACIECDEPPTIRMGKNSALSEARSHHDETGHTVRVEALGDGGTHIVGDT